MRFFIDSARESKEKWLTDIINNIIGPNAMKSYYLRTVASFALMVGISGTAYGADPVGPSAYDWSGIYGGAFVGRSSSDFTGYFDDDWGEDTGDYSLNPEDTVFGALVGYNVQRNRLVVGIEGDYSILHGRDRADNGGYTTHEAGISSQGIASLRGRLGVLVTERALVYGTGGIAYSDAHATIKTTDSEASLNVDSRGFVFGGGVEYAVTDDLRLRIEGLYYTFDDRTETDVISSTTDGDHIKFDDSSQLRAALVFNF